MTAILELINCLLIIILLSIILWEFISRRLDELSRIDEILNILTGAYFIKSELKDKIRKLKEVKLQIDKRSKAQRKDIEKPGERYFEEKVIDLGDALRLLIGYGSAFEKAVELKEFSIGELANATGLTRSAIRIWINECLAVGLLVEKEDEFSGEKKYLISKAGLETIYATIREKLDNFVGKI